MTITGRRNHRRIRPRSATVRVMGELDRSGRVLVAGSGGLTSRSGKETTVQASDAVTAVSFRGVRGGSIVDNRVEGIAPADAVDLDGTTDVPGPPSRRTATAQASRTGERTASSRACSAPRSTAARAATRGSASGSVGSRRRTRRPRGSAARLGVHRGVVGVGAGGHPGGAGDDLDVRELPQPARGERAAGDGDVGGPVPRPDVVVAVSPVLLTVLAALRWRRDGRTALGVVTQDLYSRALTETRMTSSRMAGWGAKLEGALLSRADGIAVVHEQFAAPLADLGVDPARITTIPNWSHIAPSTADRAATRRGLGWRDGSRSRSGRGMPPVTRSTSGHSHAPPHGPEASRAPGPCVPPLAPAAAGGSAGVAPGVDTCSVPRRTVIRTTPRRRSIRRPGRPIAPGAPPWP